MGQWSRYKHLRNIAEYERGDYYFDVNVPVTYIVKSLCGLLSIRGGRIGYYGEYDKYCSLEINGYKRNGKSVISVTVIDDKERTFKYEIGETNNRRRSVINSIVTDAESYLRTGKYIKTK